MYKAIQAVLVVTGITMGLAVASAQSDGDSKMKMSKMSDKDVMMQVDKMSAQERAMLFDKMSDADKSMATKCLAATMPHVDGGNRHDCHHLSSIPANAGSVLIPYKRFRAQTGVFLEVYGRYYFRD